MLTIGDFSKATNLTVKTLRHYHAVGLLEPVDVSSDTGYRYYAVEQVPKAQVIRRLRDLEMPVGEVRAVLGTEDVAGRNALIAAHLDRLEQQLAQTHSTIESLRKLLMQPDLAQAIEHRSVPATPALAIRATVPSDGFGEWWASSIIEIRAVLAERGQTASGPCGGLFADELFTDDGGFATVFVPVDEPGRGAGRVQSTSIPAVELATVVHHGPHLDVDRAYGALATHVARSALGVDGPLREYYPVSYLDTADETQWVTEIGWPIFRTAAT